MVLQCLHIVLEWISGDDNRVPSDEVINHMFKMDYYGSLKLIIRNTMETPA